MSLLPKDKRILQRVGENIKLARLRRRISAELLSQRAGISRTTLWNLEKGNPSASISTLIKVLAVLGLQDDMLKLAEDDILGRKIQDANLTTPARVRK